MLDYPVLPPGESKHIDPHERVEHESKSLKHGHNTKGWVTRSYTAFLNA